MEFLAGRIGLALYNQLPDYTKSINIFDIDSSCFNSDSISRPNSKSFVPVSSMDDLFLQSDIVIVVVTDDLALNDNLISSDFLKRHSLHGLINISRDYMVSIWCYRCLESNRLSIFCSDFINMTGFPKDKAFKLHSSDAC